MGVDRASLEIDLTIIKRFSYNLQMLYLIFNDT